MANRRAKRERALKSDRKLLLVALVAAAVILAIFSLF